MIQQFQNKTFLISRTDAIGDVVLTLPMCGWLKQNIPGAKVLFLGRTYTKPVVECCPDVDAFINWDELEKLPEDAQITALQQLHIDVVIHVFPNKAVARLARKAAIPLRIGTRNRFFHWFTCNKLVALSRRHSPLHESQLNLELLRPVGLSQIPVLSEMHRFLNLNSAVPLPAAVEKFLKPGLLHVILHPKSKGHGREWGLENYAALARELHRLGVQVFITGSTAEQELLHGWLEENKAYITDMTGKLSLPEFISFIQACDGLVASGTGPLHVASALGIHALGLFPPIKPIHPGRWAPIGAKAEYLVFDKDCNDCRKDPQACTCMKQLTVLEVSQRVMQWK